MGLLPSAVTVTEGSKVLSSAQYSAIAFVASCNVNDFGELGAVEPVPTFVSNLLHEIMHLEPSDDRDPSQMSLTTSNLFYKLSIEGEHAAMVRYISPELCSGCLRVATINYLRQKTIAGRFLQKNCALATMAKVWVRACATYINCISRRTLSSTAVAIGD